MRLTKKITSFLLSVMILASCAAIHPRTAVTPISSATVQSEMTSADTAKRAFAPTMDSEEHREKLKAVNTLQDNRQKEQPSVQNKETPSIRTSSTYTGSYYSSLGNLEGLLTRTDRNGIVEDLRSLMNSTDKKHPSYYGTGSNTLYYWFSYSERAENDTHSGLRLFYTSQYTTTYNWNREHVWPQSLSGGLFGTTGAGCDLHHIRPTYSVDNSTRSNNPYGDVVTVSKTVYSQGDTAGERIAYIGKTQDGSTAFEPRDDYKGDIARIIAYLAMHYESLYSIVSNVVIGGYDTIVAWNNLDPVDGVELNRNNVAFSAQGNRNPFIDEPDLINVIWGSGATQTDRWSVVQNLTNFTSSNSVTSVAKDASFHTVLSVKDGCTFTSLNVTMGGQDVTDTYYNYATGVLYISKVTGNIVINAVAQGSGTDIPDDPIEEGKQRFVKIADMTDLAVGDRIVVTLCSSMIAAKSSVTGSALDSTSVTANDTYLDTANQEIIWTIEKPSSNTQGYFKLKSVNNGMYLDGGSSTAVSLSSSGDDLYLASDGSGGYSLRNADCSNRFLGTSASSTDKPLKWYAASNLSSTSYEHDTVIYRYVPVESQDDFVYTENGSGITLTAVNLTDSTVTVPTVIDGKTVTKIGDRAFASSSATSITIPNTVTEMGASIFENCSNLQQVTLSSNLTFVDVCLFKNCISLSSVSLPSEITVLSDGMFLGCSSLSSVTLPEGLEEIGSHVFGGCTSLTDITIPEDVSELGIGIFSGCASLESVTLPEYITYIPDGMFEGCTSLAEIGIPADVNTIGNSSFKNCIALTEIELPAPSANTSASAHTADAAQVRKANTGLTSLAESAFEGCTSLRRVSIPSSVNTVGAKAFYGCEELNRAAVYNANASIASNAFEGAGALFTLYGYENSTAENLNSYTFKSLSDISYRGIRKAVENAKKILSLRGAHYTEETANALSIAITEGTAIMEDPSADMYQIDCRDDDITFALQNLRRVS